MSTQYFIGLMTGTSIDGIDACLVSITNGQVTLVDAINHELPLKLKKDIISLCTPGENELFRTKILDRQLGQVFADATNQLLKKNQVSSERITAIGSHGQTIRHHPEASPAFSVQIGDPNTIAELTGITTVADFRQRDIAAGGQGAPLLPIFHKKVLIEDKYDIVLNLGGIANISFLDAQDQLIGFDTGPANLLMDYWINQHHGKNYDKDGEWAKAGQLNNELLAHLKNEPYFSQTAPKSTGRELFNSAWLAAKLSAFPGANLPAEDIQRTLLELTCSSIIDALPNPKQVRRIITCGGGAHNRFLINRLQHIIGQQTAVLKSDALGIPADWIEAIAFAWFAHNTLNKRASNVPSCTGAKGERILGGIYYA